MLLCVRFMNITIIQPPLVQLNTPYPAGAYLSAFFRNLYKKNNIHSKVIWYDFSEELFHIVFSGKGLTKLFEISSEKALKTADKAEKSGDDEPAFQLRRYVSESGLWCCWIDKIIAIVCGSWGSHEYVHEFIRSAHVPRGMRMEKYLSMLERNPSADDAEILASLALADIADYITAVFDNNFSLIRYAEAIAGSISSFSDIEKQLDAPVLSVFYEQLLSEKIPSLNEKTVFCISIPFPGTFTAALYTAQYLKKHFGKNAVIGIGGGYVNTELRNLHEPKIFSYIDFVSYDRGYGSFISLFNAGFFKENEKNIFNGKEYYKIKYCLNGKIIGNSDTEKSSEFSAEIKLENDLTKQIIPDFSDIDFSVYPHLADTTNPMQRIWSDGTWMKVYLAYGCYWHRCAFCDTSLEYVKGYCLTDIQTLYKGLRIQAAQTNVYGLHFVDEACPPAALKQFALLNCAEEKRFTFWGNIRFEKTFTRDLADLLSYGGMTGVSAGIEIATGDGLNAVNKGTTLENIVGACCAFKEAGILVHSYMIYGFWNQSEQDLIDSMETLRQFFAAGLLDSAFWHKFTLTKHSTVYKEWEQGKHPDLKPVFSAKDSFAENEVQFEGENESEKYGNALNVALENWMNGEKINKPVKDWFDFKMPEPSIKKNFIDTLIKKYENNRDLQFSENSPESRYIWLGGKPFLVNSKNGKQLCWSYMGNLLYADVISEKIEKTTDFFNKIKLDVSDKFIFSGKDAKDILGRKLFSELRGKGLCKI